MRLSSVLPVALCALTAAAEAAPPAPPAAVLFTERSALLAADEVCGLLSAPVAAAVAAGRAQARNDLRRAGWTPQRLAATQARAESAGRARACADPALVAAANDARAGYAAWSRMHEVTFPGLAASWRARRTPAPEGGWRLVQDLAATPGARFGVREISGVQSLVLALPDGPAPGSARLVLRDVKRAPLPQFDVPGRIVSASTLEAGLPVRGQDTAFLARAIRREPVGPKGGAAVVVVFPQTALDAIAALDPRETIEIVLDDARRGPRRALVEVGDVGAARAFLAAQPET